MKQVLLCSNNDHRQDEWANGAMVALTAQHIPGPFLAEGDGHIVLEAEAEKIRLTIDGMADVITGGQGHAPVPTASVTGAFISNKVMEVKKLNFGFSWPPGSAMEIPRADLPNDYPIKGIDLVQPVSATVNSAGKAFLTIQVVETTVDKVMSLQEGDVTSGHYPVSFGDVACINTRTATAYGTKLNEKPEPDHWNYQIFLSVLPTAKAAIAITRGGGVSVIAHAGMARRMFGPAITFKGKPMPWAEAGEGWLIMGLELDDELKAYLSTMGKCCSGTVKYSK